MNLQTSLSHEKFVKYNLFRLHVKGGLVNEDKTQIVEGSYLPDAYGMTDKIVIDFGIGSINKDEFEQKPVSLRFASYEQIHSFIFHLIRASVILAKRQNRITPKNKAYRMNEDMKAIEDFYNEATI